MKLKLHLIYEPGYYTLLSVRLYKCAHYILLGSTVNEFRKMRFVNEKI